MQVLFAVAFTVVTVIAVCSSLISFEQYRKFGIDGYTGAWIALTTLGWLLFVLFTVVHP